MKFRPLVALGLPLGVLRFASAVLAEVLGGLGDDILEELKGDAAKRRPCPASLWIPLPSTCYAWLGKSGALHEVETKFFSLVNLPPRVMSKKTLRTWSASWVCPPSLFSKSKLDQWHPPRSQHPVSQIHGRHRSVCSRHMHMHRPGMTYSPQLTVSGEEPLQSGGQKRARILSGRGAVAHTR